MEPLHGQPPAAPLQPGIAAWTRRIARIAALGVVTFVFVLLWFAATPITLASPGARRAWRRIVFPSWSRCVLRICGVHLVRTGALPAEPCFLVTNHLGYLDIVVIAACFDATFVSMKEVTGWPVFGLMARQFGTVLLDRKRKRDIPDVNREMERALERSDVVVIFPEGRHSRGVFVLPFRTALLEPAARSGRPVACGVLHYATGPHDPPAARAVPWVGETFQKQVLVLLALSRIDARLDIVAVVRGSDRKQLAEESRARIVERFEPLDAELAQR
jgi:1-acyl-sn-glycerol-3-phosphate acyltransferase